MLAAEIGAILKALNLVEIRPSQIAMARVQDTEVKRFAEDMVQEHRLLQRRAELLMMENDVDVRESDLSTLLMRNLEPVMTDLWRSTPEQLASSYVVQQLGSHQFAIDTLDNLLIPSAEDEKLERFLRNEVRPMFEQHLERVQRIHERMVGPSGVQRPPS